MIIIKLEGGLGNQMFQFALGRALSLSHRVPLRFDSSYLQRPNQSGRTLFLDGFRVDITEATRSEIARYAGTLQKALDCLRPAGKRRKVFERSPGFDPSVLTRSAGYFVGHWSSEKYFTARTDIIRKDFTLKKPLSPGAEKAAGRIGAASTPVSVHIRRGDYVTLPKVAAVHRTLPLSYYEAAMENMLGRARDAHFFVSSDDIGWARAYFPQKHPITFISAPDIAECEELTLMSRCAHHIIANSTYSWWAAWLNRNPEKTVIAPRQWFNDPHRTFPDLIPPIWNQL